MMAEPTSTVADHAEYVLKMGVPESKVELSEYSKLDVCLFLNANVV